ncbi:hypothetical protein D3C84_304750 [compost metagenome]
MLRLHRVEGFLAIAGGIRLQVELAEHAADHLGRNAVVFGDQDAEIARHIQRSADQGRGEQRRVAAAALGQLVGQGGLERVAGHRLGQDALDSGVARDDLAR